MSLSATPPQSPEALAASEQIRERLATALEEDPHLVQRLRHARAAVAFAVDGAAAPAAVLGLDRTPPVVLEGDAPAEICIQLRPADARRFAAGDLVVTASILDGRTTYSGPVRQYLEIDPILRRLLADAAGADAVGRDRRPEERDEHIMPSRDAFGPPSGDLLAVETRGVHQWFGNHHVLRGIDLAIPEGVISTIVGPSGTGKSVLLQHLVGLMQPVEGSVYIRGECLGDMSRSRLLELRRSIGVMYQDGALFSTLTVFDNVAFPLRQHTDYGEREIRDLTMEHLNQVGLGHAARLMPAQLSGGMKKRAGLARALVLTPSIVLCDEPDSGLDPVRTALLGELLVEQHAEYGGTMIVVTHDVQLARQISDHISVVWGGHVLESGQIGDVMASDSAFVRQFLTGDTVGPLGMDA